MNRRNLGAPGLLDVLQVGVLLTDSRGRPTRANTAAQRLLNCQADGSLAPKASLALASEAQRTARSCEQDLAIGQTTVHIRAVPVDGGAMLELHDVSAPRRLQQAYRDLLAAISDTLLARVEPLGVLVEVLSAADDPIDTATVLQHLRTESDTLGDLLRPPSPAAETNGTDLDRPVADPGPAPQIASARPFRVDQPTVLLVHPADGLIDALTIGLSQAGLTGIAARDVHQALEIVETVDPDVIVLDPAASGLTAADASSKLRAATKAPMVLLDAGTTPPETAGSPPRDVLVLRRPVRYAELIAAIQESLAARATTHGATGPDVLAVGDVVLDQRAHAVRVRGEPIEIPPKEFELLRVLLVHADRAISRERLIELIWGSDYAAGRKNLHTHMKRLRHRIERDPTTPEYIITIRGFGYRFAAPSHSNAMA